MPFRPIIYRALLLLGATTGTALLLVLLLLGPTPGSEGVIPGTAWHLALTVAAVGLGIVSATVFPRAIGRMVGTLAGAAAVAIFLAMRHYRFPDVPVVAGRWEMWLVAYGIAGLIGATWAWPPGVSRLSRPLRLVTSISWVSLLSLGTALALTLIGLILLAVG